MLVNRDLREHPVATRMIPNVLGDLRGLPERSAVRRLSRSGQAPEAGPGTSRRFRGQRALRKPAASWLDSVALDLARRKVGGSLAHRRRAPPGPGGGPLGDLPRLPLAGW